MSLQPLNPIPVGPTAPMGAAQAMPSKPPPEGIEVGIEMLKRLEPDLTPLSMEVMVCSIAVSMRGIHNDLSSIKNALEAGNFGQRDSLAAIKDAVTNLRSELGSVSSGLNSIAKAKREAIQNELSKMPY